MKLKKKTFFNPYDITILQSLYDVGIGFLVAGGEKFNCCLYNI
jgi:hypothetical protein